MPSTIENLLNLKIWKEDEAKNRFALSLKDLATEEEILKNYKDKLLEIEDDFKKYNEGSIDLSKIKDVMAHQEYLIRKIAEIKKNILKKEEIVERHRLELVEATKEKRIFHRLFDKQKEQELKKQQRLEQIITDESASVRFTANEE
ncbi:MAG TPA: hypothetical protein HPP56_05420 [Nitrospirae bacterium]|nr:hypothetical protein [Nitrospirota bacterium]